MNLYWSEADRALFRDGARFDPWVMVWRASDVPSDTVRIIGPDALVRLAAEGGVRWVPVGIIGPKAATADERAGVLGAGLARMGLQLLCGGKNGVMESACKGNLDAGGLPIGLLPDDEWTAANDYVAIPIATGVA